MKETSDAIHDSRITHTAKTISAFHALLLLILFNLSLQPLVDPDFGWHLRTGLDLIKNGWHVPRADPYSHTMPDWPWVEHAWLMDGVIGWVFIAGGSAGGLSVISLFAVIIAGAFMVGAAPARARRTAKCIAIVTAAWTALPFLGARIQMITLLGVAMMLYLWRKYVDHRVSNLWVIPPLFLLWANLHGGFTAGLFLFGVMVAISVVMRLTVSRWPAMGARLDEPILTWPQLRHVTLILSVSALLTFINPYGWRLYEEIYGSLTDRLMIDTLREWQPISLQSYSGAMFVTYVTLVLVGVLAWYRRIEPVRWTIVAVCLGFSLRHWRNVPFFLLVSLPLTAEMLAEAGKRAKYVFSIPRQNLKYLSLASASVLATAMVLMGADHIERVVLSGLAPEIFFQKTEYPIEAVQWIHGHRDQIGTRVFNDYGLGGFLLWWLPTEKIFIDGRMPAWKTGNRWIFYDYLALTNRDPPELGVLDKYNVDWAIVGRESLLSQTLKNQSTWRVVYEDAKASIHVRR